MTGLFVGNLGLTGRRGSGLPGSGCPKKHHAVIPQEPWIMVLEVSLRGASLDIQIQEVQIHADPSDQDYQRIVQSYWCGDPLRATLYKDSLGTDTQLSFLPRTTSPMKLDI